MKTEVQGIHSKDLLGRFQNLEEGLQELKERYKPQPKDQLLTRQEVASLLTISLPTLHSWTSKGILQSYRIGNKIRYKKDEVLMSLKRISYRSVSND
ncbi:hypothetical protein BUL40_10360 [Croceivirga radicis]|uniref:Helix-turn-helix domain-containing protein n=1 Tax=Croceivirga radicis TaxID=1929488 RepID=A0A1V6LR42_9FLAO|nr:hypothetical protein BUL40_10360 [Croceivirga radicis]